MFPYLCTTDRQSEEGEGVEVDDGGGDGQQGGVEAVEYAAEADMLRCKSRQKSLNGQNYSRFFFAGVHKFFSTTDFTDLVHSGTAPTEY